MITPEINVFLGVFHCQKSLSNIKMTSHIRDFLNPISGSRIPLVASFAEAWIEKRETYPTLGILLYPISGNYIPYTGIYYIPL